MNMVDGDTYGPAISYAYAVRKLRMISRSTGQKTYAHTRGEKGVRIRRGIFFLQI